MFNVIILGIASFLTELSSEMVYPLLPLYLSSARIMFAGLLYEVIRARFFLWRRVGSRRGSWVGIAD